MSELRPDSPTRRPDTARPRAGEAPPPEVDPPTDDEIARVQEQLVALPREEGATISRDAELGVTLAHGPGSGPDVTYAAIPRWSGAEPLEMIDRVRTRMRDAGSWPSLMLCDPLDGLQGIEPRLEAAGWMRVTTETVMSVGHASVVPHLDPLLRIEAVQPRSIDLHEELERGIFGIATARSEARRKAAAAALEAGRLRGWIVWLEDEPVAVARLLQGDGVAALQGIGVTESRRGQGFGTLITTIATRAGMAVGNRIVWLSVDASDAAAARVYARLGFAPLFTWTRWLLAEDPRERR